MGPSLRQKKQVSYSTVLELPSDAESVVSNMEDELMEPAAGPSKRVARRKPARKPDDDDDDDNNEEDSDVSNFQASSVESEDEPIEADGESEEGEGEGGEEDFAPEQSPRATQTKTAKRQRKRDDGQKRPLHLGRLGVRQEDSTIGAEDVDIGGGDDLTGLLAGPSTSNLNRDKTHNRLEILQSSIPNTPFGHTKLTTAPILGGDGNTSALEESHAINGMSNVARLQHMGDTTEGQMLESHWSKWVGEPWSADGVAGRKEEMIDVMIQEPRKMSESEAKPYLPEEAGPITCTFGNDDEATKVEIPLYGTHSLATTSILNAGWVFNAGGPITGLAWRPSGLYEEHDPKQYLAIAPHSLSMDREVEIETKKRSGKEPPTIPIKSIIQIWQLDDGELACKQVFCIDRESFIEIKWLPPQMWSGLDAQNNLGLMSAVSNDGQIYFFCLPKLSDSITDGPEYYHLQPLASIRADEAACICSDWTDGGRFAVGLSNGAISVYQLSEAFVRGADSTRPIPIQYLHPYSSGVKSIAWITQPPTDADGAALLDKPPCSLVSSSFDGGIFVSDIRDPSSSFSFTTVSRFVPIVAWAQHVDVILFSEQDYWISLCRLRRSIAPRTSKVQDHDGAVMSMAASDYHGMAASAGADGTVRVTNLIRSTTRIPKARSLIETLYRLDFDLHTSEYRMVDNHLPQPLAPDAKHSDKGVLRKDRIANQGEYRNLGVAWNPNASIVRVQWQNGAGLNNAGILGSGSGSGLGRIDVYNERRDEAEWLQKGTDAVIIKEESDTEEEDEDTEMQS